MKDGSPCWNYLSYNTKQWIGGPGIGNSETSEGIAKTVGSITIHSDEVKVGDQLTFTITDPAALKKIRTWIRGEKNAGFLLTTDEASGRQNAILIASREDLNQVSRPRMSLWVTLPPLGTVVVLQ